MTIDNLKMDDKKGAMQELKLALRDFAVRRDWLQYQSPKNLSMALIAEAAELVEHFQWKTQQESFNLDEKTHEEVRYEMADILIYLMRIADQLDVDLLSSAQEKMTINEKRFPVPGNQYDD